MIPKGDGGDFRRIGLLYVLWKTLTGLINRQFTLEIGLRDVLHGLRAGRSTGIDALKYNMLQQITSTR